MAIFDPKLQAVTGALRTKEKRPSDVKVWRKGSQFKKRPPKGLHMDLIADRPWVIAMDARLLVEHVSNAVAVNHSMAIEQGRNVKTGASLPPPKRGGIRFNRSGKFWKSIRRTKITGRIERAKTKVDTPLVKEAAGFQRAIGQRFDLSKAGKTDKAGYQAAITNEALRDIRYFQLGGQLDRVTSAATSQAAQAMLDGNSREPNVRMMKAKAMRGLGK